MVDVRGGGGGDVKCTSWSIWERKEEIEGDERCFLLSSLLSFPIFIIFNILRKSKIKHQTSTSPIDTHSFPMRALYETEGLILKIYRSPPPRGGNLGSPPAFGKNKSEN